MSVCWLSNESTLSLSCLSVYILFTHPCTCRWIFFFCWIFSILTRNWDYDETPHIRRTSCPFQHCANPRLFTEHALVQNPGLWVQLILLISFGVLESFGGSLWWQFFVRGALGACASFLWLGQLCLLCSRHCVRVKSVWNKMHEAWE